MEIEFYFFTIPLLRLIQGLLLLGAVSSLGFWPALGGRAYGQLLKDGVAVGFISAVLFVPIVGMVLKDRSLVFQIQRSLMLVASVFVGRMLITGVVQMGLSAWLVKRLSLTTLLVVLSTFFLSGVERNLVIVAILALLLVAFSLERTVGVISLDGYFSGLGTGWGRVVNKAEGKLGLLLFFLVGALIVIPFLPYMSKDSFITDYHIQNMTQTLIYVMLAIGLNIVVGLAGLLDLGYVAFYAVGAYGYALLTAHFGEFGIGFWWAIPITASLAAFAGFTLGFPVLRMHGDYLAIVTLGFGEIIRILLVNMIGITGGPNGISAPRPTLLGLEFTRRAKQGGVPLHEYFGIEYDPTFRYTFIYLLALGFSILAIFIFKRLREMPIGRAWEALREDETACKALGINHTTTKLSAFTLGASFAGVGGVLYASNEGFINPSSFTFIESAIILSIVVLGGMGSITGVIIAASILTLLPELFRDLAQYRMLGFGLAMVFIMIWRPGGLLKVNRRAFLKVSPPLRTSAGEAD